MPEPSGCGNSLEGSADRAPLPRVHLGAGESSGTGWQSRVPRTSFRPLHSRAGGDRRRWEAAHTRPGGRCRPRPASRAFVAAAPGLPGSHCGIRGPINRESDVLQSREWRGPGSWGRGRPSHRLPGPPSSHVTRAPGSHLPSRAEGLCPLGSRGGGSATPPLGVTWEGAGGTRAVPSFDRPAVAPADRPGAAGSALGTSPSAPLPPRSPLS